MSEKQLAKIIEELEINKYNANGELLDNMLFVDCCHWAVSFINENNITFSIVGNVDYFSSDELEHIGIFKYEIKTTINGFTINPHPIENINHESIEITKESLFNDYLLHGLVVLKYPSNEFIYLVTNITYDIIDLSNSQSIVDVQEIMTVDDDNTEDSTIDQAPA